MTDFAERRARHIHEVRRALRRHRGECVASHESAAMVHGLATYHLPRVAVLTRPDGFRRTGRTHVHVAALPPTDRCVVNRVPVTTPVRTCLDIARARPFREALVTADSLLRAGYARDALHAWIQHASRWPGIASAGRVTASADGAAESAAESVVRARFIELGLELPELQVLVECVDGGFARVDFWWRRWRLAGEVDGRVKYMDDALWREKLRQERLEDAGVTVLRWTWTQAHDTDDAFIARFAAAVERARRRGKAP